MSVRRCHGKCIGRVSHANSVPACPLPAFGLLHASAPSPPWRGGSVVVRLQKGQLSGRGIFLPTSFPLAVLIWGILAMRGMSDLCDTINRLVEKHRRRALKTGQIIDVPDVATKLTECLADVIVRGASPKEQTQLVGLVLTKLNRFLLEKRRAGLGPQVQ